MNAVIKTWYAKLPSDATQFALVDGGAAGDPASLGVSWIMAESAQTSSVAKKYATIASREIDYQLETVGRSSAGAISTRPPSETVQLWSDWVYMVPPFLAYYGVTQTNTTLITAAFEQIALYRDELATSNGLWKHVVLGDWQSNKLWGTGEHSQHLSVLNLKADLPSLSRQRLGRSRHAPRARHLEAFVLRHNLLERDRIARSVDQGSPHLRLCPNPFRQPPPQRLRRL